MRDVASNKEIMMGVALPSRREMTGLDLIIALRFPAFLLPTGKLTRPGF